MRLAIALSLVLAATTSRQGCGNGSTPPAYDPCAGKSCGDGCTACPPDAKDCYEPAVVKACDPLQRCVPLVDGLCSAAQDACAGKACGAECVIDPPCRDADPPCMMPSVLGHCDTTGACIPVPSPVPLCPPPPPSWGCVGKACGDSCGVCPPGTDPASCPVPTFAATACDARLQCVTVGTFTCTAAEACEGKACGDACDVCGACMHPYATACDYAGWCGPVTPWLCYDPCAGKACGAGCHLCPPDAADCGETAELKECDASGRCVSWTDTFACPP